MRRWTCSRAQHRVPSPLAGEGGRAEPGRMRGRGAGGEGGSRNYAVVEHLTLAVSRLRANPSSFPRPSGRGPLPSPARGEGDCASLVELSSSGAPVSTLTPRGRRRRVRTGVGRGRLWGRRRGWPCVGPPSGRVSRPRSRCCRSDRLRSWRRHSTILTPLRETTPVRSIPASPDSASCPLTPPAEPVIAPCFDVF